MKKFVTALMAFAMIPGLCACAKTAQPAIAALPDMKIIEGQGIASVQVKIMANVNHANAIVARQSRPETDQLRLDAVRIGGMAFVAAPYEMFTNQSIYIKEHSPFEMTMISTCSNGDAIYIPSAEAYDYGCYESYVSYYGKGVAEQAADKFLEMLNQLK